MDSTHTAETPPAPMPRPPRRRRESSATRRARAASRKPAPPAQGWVSAADLSAWLWRGGWGTVSPTTLARWQALGGVASFAACWRSGGGRGRANWYHPERVARWLYETESRTYPRRTLRQRLFPHPELPPRLFAWHWSARHPGLLADRRARSGG